MAELLTMPFMQRALAAAVLTGFLGGLLGVFLIQRRLAFLAAGVSHGSFAGIGLGLFLGVAPFAVAVPVALGIGLVIAFLRLRGNLAEDTVVGILFAAGMALGVLLLSLAGANASLSAYLFGSILAIGNTDLAFMTGITAAVAAFTVPTWGRLTLVTFDRQLAQASGVRVRLLDYGFYAAASLAIVASVKVVGVVLVASFFVVPAATARLLGGTFLAITMMASSLGALTAVTGLLLSYPVEAPVGALIVLLQGAVFAVVMGLRGRPG
ncbi:metal ABC transporter permease [Thiohalorhabdus sp.]|uniref:metal ABC transporter permease n=1 Tax=Thiohalorhabdus sp. TaxID=3094134 RepID=UPI002FC2E339